MAGQSTAGDCRNNRFAVDGQIKRLLELEANNMLATHRVRRASIEHEIMLLTPDTPSYQSPITKERVDKFAQVMRSALASGDAAFRETWLRLFVDAVVMSNTEIRITRPTSSLAEMAAKDTSEMDGGTVPNFVR